MGEERARCWKRGAARAPWFRIVAVALLLGGSCRSAPSENRPAIGLMPSALPNIGLAVEGSLPFRKLGSFDTSVSARYTHQWLDDSDLADDGNVAAGDWSQLDVGLLGFHDLGGGRRATLRLAAVWMRARGEPNIIDDAGDYYGAGLGVGLRTRLSRDWSFGPELSIFFGRGDGQWVKTPQLVWGLHWSPRRSGGD